LDGRFISISRRFYLNSNFLGVLLKALLKLSEDFSLVIGIVELLGERNPGVSLYLSPVLGTSKTCFAISLICLGVNERDILLLL
jgi:hypothetical protein